MKFKDAKILHNEDQVQRKSDGVILTVSSADIHEKGNGSFVVMLHCIEPGGALVTLTHTEVK